MKAGNPNFVKRHKRQGVRNKSAPNKPTKTIKETVLAVFNELQEDPKINLLEWGRSNPKDFYSIAARTKQTELTGKDSKDLIPSQPLTKEELIIFNKILENEV